MINIKTTRFGPVESANINVRPLTFFIGPNGVGKSYLALLLYSIFRAVGPQFHFQYGSFLFYPRDPFSHVLGEKKDRKALQEWVVSFHKEKVSSLRFNEIPENFQGLLRNSILRFIEGYVDRLESELKRCFGSELRDLTSGQSDSGFVLEIHQDTPPLSLTMESKGRRLRLVQKSFSLDQLSISFERSEPPEVLLYQLAFQLFSNISRQSFYLPAARSGILQGHKAIAGALVSRSPLVGLEDIEIPKLSGVVADFISLLLRLDRPIGRHFRQPSNKAVADIARFIEANVLGGRIDLEPPRSTSDYPEVYYRLGKRKYAMHQSSSMISEMAPVVLFMKYIISPGNLLLIEEPEAHLHPDNQRVFARAIAKMIRAGVNVVLTTHSDYFLQQLSNLMLLSNVDRRAAGYPEDEYLKEEEVAGWLLTFSKPHTSSTSRPISISATAGIVEEEFAEIAHSLYKETASLERRLNTTNASDH